MFRPGARSKKIVLVLTALVVMVAVASLMVTPAFAAGAYSLDWMSYVHDAVSAGTIEYIAYQGSSNVISSFTPSVTDFGIQFRGWVSNGKLYYFGAKVPINLTVNDDYVNYWRVSCKIFGIDTTYFSYQYDVSSGDITRQSAPSLTYTNGSSTTTVQLPRQTISSDGSYVIIDFYLEVDSIITIQSLQAGLFMQSTSNQSAYPFIFRVEDLTVTSVNELQYEQWLTMQQSNQIQQGISDTLNNGTQANQNANQQGSQAADNFNNTVGDYSDLNNALDKPEAGADFSTDFGEITQDAYNASFVASTLGALYDNPAIIYSMLLTASFCVLGYILYGKRI